MSNVVVCALYKFVTLDNYSELKTPLLDFMLAENLRGTLLLASEGINGTVAGSREAVDSLLAFLQEDTRLAGVSYKESFVDTMPFLRTRVKHKKEILTKGVQGNYPKRSVGTYVKPKDWNALISNPDVVLVDTRNDYEVKVGTFRDALNPDTDSFREFPKYVKENLDPTKNKKVAMFCTGGIRCEKSTAYLKEQGFEEVYHLEGGVLKYLEDVPEQESMWEGECFVFDERVTVNHALEKGGYDLCNGCRMPISEQDKLSVHYQLGVSCHYCFDNTTPEQKARFEERQKQMDLAEQRGENHMGADMASNIAENKLKKQQAREKQRQASLKKQSK